MKHLTTEPCSVLIIIISPGCTVTCYHSLSLLFSREGNKNERKKDLIMSEGLLEGCGYLPLLGKCSALGYINTVVSLLLTSSLCGQPGQRQLMKSEEGIIKECNIHKQVTLP